MERFWTLDSRQHRAVTPKGEECSEPRFPHVEQAGVQMESQTEETARIQETVMAMLCPPPFNSHVGAQPPGPQGYCIWIGAFIEVIKVK